MTTPTSLAVAKASIDHVMTRGRVHFYKPFQVAEILFKHRQGLVTNLSDLEAYRNSSKRWRDEVSNRLVGRSSTSSARYQDDVFNASAVPPQKLAVLGEFNRANGGIVEAYIYRSFAEKLGQIFFLREHLQNATTSTFNLDGFIASFEREPGLKRSVDKVFEIAVYALFASVVRALKIQVTLSIGNVDTQLLRDFSDFLGKVVGLQKEQQQLTVNASLFRVGSTNAADGGFDVISNFGPAIQVKHLTLDSSMVADICDGITAERLILVCKDAELEKIDAVIRQLGLDGRIQAIVTQRDLQTWYGLCMNESHANSIGLSLLSDLRREFDAEFPSLGELPDFLKERGYDKVPAVPPFSFATRP